MARRRSALALACVVLGLGVPGAETGDRVRTSYVPLFPLIYQESYSTGESTVWALLLFWHGRGADGKTGTMVFPAYWNERTSGVIPVFMQWDDDFVFLPLGGKVGETAVVGPVWWGPNYFTFFPLLWHWDNSTLLFPLSFYSATPEESQFNILWRLFRQTRSGTSTITECQPFFSTESDVDRYQFSILWRVFEYHRDPGESYWRLLLSPKIPLH